MTQTGLVDLESLKGYRVVSEEPDPRGWIVVCGDAEPVGVVRTMLVDPELLKARFFVVELEQQRRRVLVPVIYSRLDPEKKRVIFDTAPAEAFAQLPVYADVVPDEATEDEIHKLIAGTTPPAADHGVSAERRQEDRRA
jgi:photosynthetic reaction center H subunit